MRIFFPIKSFYPSQVGGPCNTVYWHTCALNENNVQVRTVTTDNGIEDGRVTKDIEIHNESGIIIYLRQKRIPFKAFKKISRNIKWSDIIHLNSLFNIFSIYSFIFIKLFFPHKNIIWSVRGELNSHALSFSARKKMMVLPFYQKFHKNLVFHATSDKETEDIRTKFPFSKIIQLPNYIPMMPRLTLDPKKQLIFVGRIHPIKAIHKLIEAVSLSEIFLNNHYKLIIAGKAEERHLPYQKELEELISELKLTGIIEFRGHVTGQEKEVLYAESHALVLPSETENFGNVVVEALNQGTPVVASLGTPWQLLEEYRCGIHVSNEPLELAKSIDRILSLPKEEYLNWRDNAKKLIDQKFNINTQIDKWIAVYNKFSR